MRAALVGTRWFATLGALETKDLRFTRIITGFRRHLIRSIFVAYIARPGERPRLGPRSAYITNSRSAESRKLETGKAQRFPVERQGARATSSRS